MDTKHPSGNFDAPLSADQELERMAVQRAEHEDEPRMPENPEEMIAATLEPVTGCVDQIIPVLSRLAVGSVSGLQDILMQINARLLAYLKSETMVKKKKTLVASAYARQCFSAASGVASADEIVIIADITAHIVAELNPLMHAAWETYSALTQDMPKDTMAQEGIPRTIEEFFTLFDRGRAEQQRVFSLFGVLKKIASEQTSIGLLDSSKVEIPREIVLTDPFGVSQKEYWVSRQRAFSKRDKSDVSLQTLVSERTLLVLNKLSELALSTHDEVLKEAAEHTGFWLHGELMQVKGLSDEAFEKYAAGLHFGYGDPEVLLTLLNSLETLKQRAPELYVEIMGRALRPLSPTDARSDLFGNLLHAALFRSLHMESGKGTEGYQILQTHLIGLTHMDSHQAMIAPLSEEEIQAIGKVIEEDVKSGSFMAVAMAPMMFKEGRDAYMLGKLLEKISVENREGLLQELRNATPDEFVRLMRGRRLLPKEIEWYESPNHPLPADVLQILKDRGFPEVAEDSSEKTHFIYALYAETFSHTSRRKVGEYGSLPFKAIGGAIEQTFDSILGGPIRTGPGFLLSPFFGAYVGVADGIVSLKERNKYITKHVSHREQILWKTTPSEKLLAGDEFFLYISRISSRIKRGGRGLDVTPENQEIVPVLFDLLNAHADITGLQWHRWLHGLQWESQGNGLEVRRKKLSEVKSVLAPIFHNSFSLIQISEGQSHFFQLFERLYPKATMMVERNPLNITDVVPASYYAWLESEKDSISPRSRAAVDPREIFAFQDVNYDKELNDYQELHMKNLLTLSMLFSPKTLADILKAYFVDNPGSVDLFCDMLSKNDREAFLAGMCENAPRSLHAAWSEQEAPLQVISAERYLVDSTIPRSPQQVTLLFSILNTSSRAIPDNKEYLNLKNLVMEHGYQSNQKSEGNRRIQYREGWILEEGKRKLPAVGDVLSKQEMKKLLSSELEWREIARG